MASSGAPVNNPYNSSSRSGGPGGGGGGGGGGGSSGGGRFGQAKMTAGADDAALRLYDAYRRLRQERDPFDQMRRVEIEGDNLEAEILLFCKFCSSTPIPHNFDENLEPRNNNNDGAVKVLMQSTLTKYVGKVIKLIRGKFPDHEDFKGLKPGDQPEWWVGMRTAFETECERFHFRLGSDFIWGDTSTRTIFDDNGNGAVKDGDAIDDYVSVLDLYNVARKLLRKSDLATNRNGPLQQRCWFAFLFHAAARGGEIKLQDYLDWVFHAKVDILDITWTEMKVLEKYSMPMVPHLQNFLLDIYHCLGSWWAVENGLFRAQDADSRAHATRVFYDLRVMSDANVTKKVTTTLRASFPDLCPLAIKKLFSAKSIRRGAITLLCNHPNIRGLDAAGRSGHATGTSIDAYLDKSYIDRGLRGGKALAGFKDVNLEVKVPRLECLGDAASESTQKLMEHLYVVSPPLDKLFCAGGQLRIVLKTCSASLIMYHQTVMRQFGLTNAVVTKLREAARRANISDARFPSLSPESLLDRWSEIIMRDFQERNPAIVRATPDGEKTAIVLNQHTDLLLKLHTMVSEMQRSNEESGQRITSQERTISALENNVSQLSQKLAQSEAKLGMLKTPPTAATPLAQSQLASKRRLASDDDVAVSSSSKRVAASASIPSAPIVASTAAAAPALSAIEALSYTARASEMEKIKGTTDISVVLGQLHRGHYLTGENWAELSVPTAYEDKWAVTNILELVEVVISPEERQALQNTATSESIVVNVANSIERKCMDKMFLYEGKDPEFEKKYNRKSNPRPSYRALGGRIKKYKNETLKPRLNWNDIKTAPPLQDPPPKPPEQLPAGQKQLDNYFTTNKKA